MVDIFARNRYSTSGFSNKDRFCGLQPGDMVFLHLCDACRPDNDCFLFGMVPEVDNKDRKAKKKKARDNDPSIADFKDVMMSLQLIVYLDTSSRRFLSDAREMLLCDVYSIPSVSTVRSSRYHGIAMHFAPDLAQGITIHISDIMTIKCDRAGIWFN